jgi:2-C-methyl-D-erythritol 4-phosphate cytidylyltransferase
MEGPTSLQPASVAVIMPAAGRGERFGGEQNKLFAELGGKPLWVHAAQRLGLRPEVGRLVMPVTPRDRDRFASQRERHAAHLEIEFVTGGARRTESVRAGLDAVTDDRAVRLVAVHDAARPLVSAGDLAAVFEAGRQSGAAVLANPVTGTLKRIRDGGRRSVTVDRRDLWVAQTPQVFLLDWFRDAYRRYRGFPVTDDAQLVERAGYDVCLVPGRGDNLKITRPEDLAVAEAILAQSTDPRFHEPS